MARVHVNPEFIIAFQTHILLVISGHLHLRRCFLCQKQLQETEVSAISGTPLLPVFSTPAYFKVLLRVSLKFDFAHE